ncbi:PTS cellobiose transporter subunit IIB [Aerococcus kribbianus]|uniref:PTS cellobiose transporter subunit IIB n=1 Tax=Aerococcus kribbianus TaxID=2999064 RepID=A0A9X3JGS8_9LACT|nr:MULTISPECIES: PTS cellobiose transporter subunit IIB [unclassified Aerococcus]MCZ0717591.1 PTS cellobiose transporter subunit IIB [Aerococcus sp. YH-aer221]MCZ0725879.1 PTS cellobiose transporter subunit IIB [Aerococcus sp. YH-aer222]
MKRVVIICMGGMSSSYISSELNKYFDEKNLAIETVSVSLGKGKKLLNEGDFDIYLISPQAKYASEWLKEIAIKNHNDLFDIAPHLYVPIPQKIEELSHYIINLIKIKDGTL